MGLFYTRKGDKGSSTVGKKKYAKDSIILEALGELDELNSFIGLVKNFTKEKKLEAVQENLFIIQARVAWIMDKEFESPVITKEKIRVLEKEIDEIEKRLNPKRGFTIPGSSKEESLMNVLRVIARRVERRIATLNKEYKLPPEILMYLNRLSSYFYALARDSAGKIEKKPSYK